MKKVVDEDGTIRYYNDRGHYHRLDGPAVEWSDDSKEWWIKGKRHRLDGPAYTTLDGEKEYWIDGKQLTEFEFMLHWIVNLPGV